MKTFAVYKGVPISFFVFMCFLSSQGGHTQVSQVDSFSGGLIPPDFSGSHLSVSFRVGQEVILVNNDCTRPEKKIVSFESSGCLSKKLKHDVCPWLCV